MIKRRTRDEPPLRSGTYGAVPVEPLLTVREMAQVDAAGQVANTGLVARQPVRRRRKAEKIAFRRRAEWDRSEDTSNTTDKQADVEYLPRAGSLARGGLTFYAPAVPWHLVGQTELGLLSPLGVSGRPVFDGPIIGRSLLTGGVFRYDCWAPVKYQMDSVNGLIVGMMGSGKSMLLKALATRETVRPWCRKVIVEGDPKSEWKPVAERLGGQVISVGNGSYLNPLDPGLRPSGAAEGSWAVTVLGLQRQALEFITAVLRTDRPLLSDAERAVIDAALRDFLKREVTPTIAALVDLWQSEWPESAVVAGLDPGAVKDTCKRLILLFDQMVHGVEAGAFERASTVSVDPLSPMTVFDTGSVSNMDEHRKMLYQACMGAAVERLCARHDGAFRIVIAEEGHELLQNPGLVAAWDRRMRLQGDLGVSNWMLLHELSDLSKFADDDTAQRNKMRSILTLATVQVIYRQSPASLSVMKDVLGDLTSAEITQIGSLPEASALWRVGDRYRDVVRAEFSPESFELFRTDQNRRG
jgi:hypothetical protein